MKLFVKEKLFSIHNKYYIYDENNQPVYEISSEVLSLGDKTTIYDMNQNKIAYIEQELLHLTSHYNVYIKDVLVYNIKAVFKLFDHDYKLSNGYEVDGEVFNHDFNILNPNGKVIAKINRDNFTVGDQYQIEIFDDNDLNLVLTILVAIANDVDRKQK